MTPTGTALVERETLSPGVTLLRLNRPDQLNAMTSPLVQELASALEIVGRDDTCHVVILTGAGPGFCAGLDLRGYQDDDRMSASGPVLGAWERQREIAELTTRIHTLRQPVIAAVNGAAAGGGLALVCAADIRIASTRALFAVSFIRAGYSACDIGLSWLLPRIVGVGRAHELMLTGRRFDAAEALRAGLLTHVSEPEELMPTAIAKALEIMENAPFSVELTKTGMWSALESPSLAATIEFENRQQLVAAMTTDSEEARRAFLEKRAPVFRRR